MRVVIGLGLLGLAVVMWLIMRGSSGAEVGGAPTVSSTSAPPLAETMSEPRSGPVVPRSEPSRMPPPSPSLAPPKGMKAQFKERVSSLDPVIARCLAVADVRPTGVAVLDFVAGLDPSTGLAVVESTGIVDDETTIANESLLACLHEGARGLPPFQVPEGIETAYAAWRLELVDGEVKNRRLTEYSLRKLTDGPFD